MWDRDWMSIYLLFQLLCRNVGREIISFSLNCGNEKNSTQVDVLFEPVSVKWKQLVSTYLYRSSNSWRSCRLNVYSIDAVKLWSWRSFFWMINVPQRICVVLFFFWMKAAVSSEWHSVLQNIFCVTFTDAFADHFICSYFMVVIK